MWKCSWSWLRILCLLVRTNAAFMCLSLCDGAPMKVRPIPALIDFYSVYLPVELCTSSCVSPWEQEQRQTKPGQVMYLFRFSLSLSPPSDFVYKRHILYSCVCRSFVEMLVCVILRVWWGVYMINTRQAWEEFWSRALQQLLWKQYQAVELPSGGKIRAVEVKHSRKCFFKFFLCTLFLKID